MTEQTYVRPTSLEQALEMLNQPGVRSEVLAGGTDLVRYMESRIKGIDRIVDVADVPELKGIDSTAEGTVRLGAAATLKEMLSDPILATQSPLLVAGCRVVGGPQVRNQATPGGNVANGAACADIATILVCLQATAVVVRPGEEHRIPVADLIDDLEEGLPPGSLIRAFEFQALAPGEQTAFLRLAPRKAVSIARVSLAILGSLDGDGKAASVRLAWGAVFGHPRRTPEVEEMIVGQAPDESLLAEAGEAMQALYIRESGDRWSAPYKRKVVTAFAERGLRQVLGSLP